MARPVIFLDDGGVMNDNARRAPQWRRLVGEFLPPLLGGTAAAWAEANRTLLPQLLVDYDQVVWPDADFAAFDRAYSLAWLYGMCNLVGVQSPPEEEALRLVHRANAFITRRVQAAYPGAVAAIRTLAGRGYRLHTASGGPSTDLEGYLEGMGVREYFGRLYGPDLVGAMKAGPAYNERIFRDADVAPEDALVLDDRADILRWVAEAGARAVLVGAPDPARALGVPVISSLAELPDLLLRLE